MLWFKSSCAGVCLVMLLMIIMMNTVVRSSQESDCPVCVRVIKASKELTKSQALNVGSSLSLAGALDKYCALRVLDVEEEQFCYNIENMRGEINRMLDMGADEIRTCKKVKSINPHFCSSGETQRQKVQVHVNDNYKHRGVIFV